MMTHLDRLLLITIVRSDAGHSVSGFMEYKFHVPDKDLNVY